MNPRPAPARQSDPRLSAGAAPSEHWAERWRQGLLPSGERCWSAIASSRGPRHRPAVGVQWPVGKCISAGQKAIFVASSSRSRRP